MSTFPLWVTEHRAFPVSTKHTISISPYTYEEGVNCQEPSEKQQLPFRRGRQTTRAERSTAACSRKNSAGWNIDTLRYCDRNFHVSCKREGFFFFFWYLNWLEPWLEGSKIGKFLTFLRMFVFKKHGCGNGSDPVQTRDACLRDAKPLCNTSEKRVAGIL